VATPLIFSLGDGHFGLSILPLSSHRKVGCDNDEKPLGENLKGDNTFMSFSGFYSPKECASILFVIN